MPVLKALGTSGGKLATIKPLTSLYGRLEYQSLVDTIEAMRPRGYTNVALGTMWGLATLSRQEPFAETRSQDDVAVKRFMVVLTDGENNYHHDAKGLLAQNQSQIDKNTGAGCTAAKTSGIEVFTILLEKGNQTLLKDCASSRGNFFNVQSEDQLKAAFKRITDAITGARLTT